MTEDGARRWPRRVVITLGVLAVLAALTGLAVRTVPVGLQPAIVAASAVPELVAVGALGTVLLAAARWWPGTAVGALVVVVSLAVQVPLFVAATPRAGRPFTVLQANLMVGAADSGHLIELVRAHDVQLLTVEELTPTALDALTSAGLDDVLPHRLVAPFPGGAGAGIWSVTPLTDPEKIEDFSFELLSATVTPDGAAPVHVVAVHLLPPWPYPSATWTAELHRLSDRLRSAPGPVIASGDFNATPDQPQFRSLLREGFADAAERSGAGWQPTYPTDKPVPPFLTLDHVLVRGVDAEDTTSVVLPGSDHRGLLARLVVPRRPPPS